MSNTRAMIYTRISSDSEGRELGVTRQLEDCTKHAESRGWTVVREYRDNDRGASTRSRKSRPEYDAMLAAVRAGEADVIVAYSASRITRRVVDWQSIIDMIEDGRRAGRTIRVETVVSGKIDVNTADGRMMLGIMAQVDQGEAERTAERITRAHKQRQDEGRHAWTRRPFGHERDGSQRLAEADAIREAARMIIEERASLYSVCQRWNAAGMQTASGAQWTIGSMGDLLRAPRLAAIMPDGRPGTWAAILTPDRHRAMCAVMDARGRAYIGSGRLALNLMSGIATCYQCGAGARVTRSGGRRRYICQVGHVAVPADALDAYVAGWVAAGRKVGRLGKGGTYAPIRAAETVDTAPLVAERDRLTADLAALADALRAGKNSAATLLPLIGDLERQRDAVTARLDAAAADAERAASLDHLMAEWDGLTVEGQRGILRDLMTAGWIFQLRPYVESEPDERIAIIDTTDVLDAGALGMLD